MATRNIKQVREAAIRDIRKRAQAGEAVRIPASHGAVAALLMETDPSIGKLSGQQCRNSGHTDAFTELYTECILLKYKATQYTLKEDVATENDPVATAWAAALRAARTNVA